MLHLFKKVYLASDSVIDVNFDRVVISARYGIKMLDALQKVSGGKLISYGTTYEEVVGDIGFADFISILDAHHIQTDKKVIIYADDAAFSKIAAAWYKSIFSNISSSDAWGIVSYYIDKQNAMRNWRTTTSATNEQLFQHVTKQRFETDFAACDSHDLQHNNHISFELLLADYLHGSAAYKDQLKVAAQTLLQRSIKELAIEVKHSYVKNKHRSTFPADVKDEQFFTQSSLYTGASIGSVSNLSTNVDIANATDADVAKFKTLAKSVFQNWDHFKVSAAIIKFVDFIDIARKNNLSDADLNAIIQFEKASMGTVRLFSSADEEKINIYFLEHVLNLDSGAPTNYELK